MSVTCEYAPCASWFLAPGGCGTTVSACGPKAGVPLPLACAALSDDFDEYEGEEDVGYWRLDIPGQEACLSGEQ